jgi:MYXO-CTERM domain-containing protein
MTFPAHLKLPSALLLFTAAACADGSPPIASLASITPSPRATLPALSPEPVGRRLGAPGLRADVTAQGVMVGPSHGAAWMFQPTPRGFGCDGALAAVGGALPAVRGGRVEYARPELREWYVAIPRGIEQGFTLPAPPACRRGGGVGVVIALGGGPGVVVAAGGQSAQLRDASGAAVLHYTDLRVVDATGRELPARLEGGGEALAIRFDDEGARYPVEVDPAMWVQEQNLTASDAVPADAFGTAVSLSGNTAVLSAPGVNGGDGAAYVFVRTGVGAPWTEQQRLTGTSPTMMARFGAAVAVSGDAAVVGASGENDGEGGAYVFTRSGSAWSLAQALTSEDPMSTGSFGAAVAIDGDTAFVGQPNPATGPGSVFVYVRSGTTWNLQQELTEGATRDGFGTAIALSGDTAVVGAPIAEITPGAAYVYVRSGTTWTVQQQLTTMDAAPGDFFGTAVAVDGDTVFVGAPTVAQQGAVFVFVRSGTEWTQELELSPGATTGYGAAVALSSGLAAVGAFDVLNDSGAVFTYTFSSGGVTLQAGLSPLDQAGTAVALEGTTLIAGAPGQLAGAGVAYPFQLGFSAGDTCTMGNTCNSGFCVDGVCCTTSACPAAGPCHGAGTCQAGTGVCSVAPINEDMPCNPGPCQTTATCHDGLCLGGTVACDAPDECHEFGICDPAIGMCTQPAKADGQPCSIGVCTGGVCVGDQTDAGATGGAGSGGGSTGGSGCDCGVRGEGTPSPVAVLLMMGLVGGVLRRGRRRGKGGGRGRQAGTAVSHGEGEREREKSLVWGLFDGRSHAGVEALCDALEERIARDDLPAQHGGARCGARHGDVVTTLHPGQQSEARAGRAPRESPVKPGSSVR